MDRPRHNDHHLAVMNKIRKNNIKKSPLHQPKPQVYNRRKNDLGVIVEQLTCSPFSDSCLPQPQDTPKPPNTWLQKNRLAAITQIERPHVRQPTHNLATTTPTMHPLPSCSQPMMGHGDQLCDSADTTGSVCMRSLQLHSPTQSHNHHSPRFNGSSRDKPILPSPRLHGRGILPSPVSVHMRHPQISFGDSGLDRDQMQPSREYQPHPPPPPRFSGSASSAPILPSPRFNGHGMLPSPTSQYLLHSPTAYPLQSPGVQQHPTPTAPRSFMFSSMGQPGILGPGKFTQPPPASPPPSPVGEITN